MAGGDFPLTVELYAPRTRELYPEALHVRLGDDESLHPLVYGDHSVVSKREDRHVGIICYFLGVLVAHPRVEGYEQPLVLMTQRDDARILYALLSLLWTVITSEVILEWVDHKISGT